MKNSLNMSNILGDKYGKEVYSPNIFDSSKFRI